MDELRIVTTLRRDTHTRRPSHLSSESSQGLDENGSLDGPDQKQSACIQDNQHQNTYMCKHPAMRAPFKGWDDPY